MKRLLLVLLLLLGFLCPAQAVLVDRGTGMIYDTALGITWLQDANYARSSGYDADGRMTWDQATAWADGLAYGGYTDWRLPKSLPVNGSYNFTQSYNGSTDAGWNISAPGSAYPGSAAKEMAYMYYNNLGNKAYFDINGNYPQSGWNVNPNAGPFQNLQSADYWSATVVPGNAGAAFGFYFFDGYTPNGVNKASSLYAWAVRDGDYGPSVSEGNPYSTGLITLGDLFSFDYLWGMGQEPTCLNFDLLAFNGTGWEVLGAIPNFGGSSGDWETYSLIVPEWARGMQTQIRFVVADWLDNTDPTVYLRNIQSAPVPEPATLLLFGAGLIGLVGYGRKKIG